MSFHWYIAGSGKNQKMYDFLTKYTPTIGYTGNRNVNLFIAAKKMYIDAHAHYGENLNGRLYKDFVQYIQPIMPDFFLGGDRAFRIKDREENLNRMERQMDKVLRYLEDKDLSCGLYELWVNDETGQTVTSSADLSSVGSWRCETFGSREALEEWRQAREDVFARHRTLMQHLLDARDSLWEAGADEDAKLLEGIIKRMRRT